MARFDAFARDIGGVGERNAPLSHLSEALVSGGAAATSLASHPLSGDCDYATAKELLQVVAGYCRMRQTSKHNGLPPPSGAACRTELDSRMSCCSCL